MTRHRKGDGHRQCEGIGRGESHRRKSGEFAVAELENVATRFACAKAVVFESSERVGVQERARHAGAVQLVALGAEAEPRSGSVPAQAALPPTHITSFPFHLL